MVDQFWLFAAAFLLGVIVGAFLMVAAGNSLTNDRIKAGYFEQGGKAYRIQEVSQ